MLVSAIQQHEAAISIHVYLPSHASSHPDPHPTPLGHHRVLGEAPCVIQQLPISYLFYTSVQFSHSVVSDSLRLHEPQHARPPCPSPIPEFTQTH